MYLRRVASFVITLVMIFQIGMTSISAQEVEVKEPINEETLNDFIDDFILYVEENYHVPHMSMAIVYDGKAVIRGYGKEDIEEGLNVNPEVTRLAIGSASKTFVYISIMQLVEEGAIELDDSIMDYVDLDLDFAKNSTVTIRQLMNHKAGFEEDLTGVLAPTYEEVLSFEEFLPNYEPRQVYQPDTYPAYSNYGNTLLAYLVEQVSGQGFEQYVQNHILNPLQMAHTAYGKEGMDHMAKRYEYSPDRDDYVEMGDVYFNDWPAGDLRSTAEDMALYMNALLGRTENQEIVLSREKLEELFTSAKPVESSFSGMSNGFIEGSYYGQDYIGHGGTTPFQFTGMNLLRDYGVGLYITSGSSEGRLVNGEFLKQFIERFLYDESMTFERDNTVELEAFTGNYYSSRTSQSNFQKIMRWFQQVTLTMEGDYILSTSGEKFYPISENILVNEDQTLRYYFEMDESGQVKTLYSSVNPTEVYFKLNDLENIGNQFLILGLVFITILLIGFGRVLSWVVHKIKKSKVNDKILKVRRFSNIILGYIMATGAVYTMMIMFFDQNALMKEELFIIKLTMFIGSLIIPAIFVFAYKWFMLMKNRDIRLYNKIIETIIFIALIILGLWLNYWKLFIWNIG